MTSPMSLLANVIERRLLAPSLLRERPEVLRRARLLVSLLLLTSACNLIFVTPLIARGQWSFALPMLAVLGCYVTGLAVVRAYGSLAVASNFLVGPFLLLVLRYVMNSGGIHAVGTWPWAVLGVTLAYLLGGRRAGGIWFGLLCATVMTFGVLDARGHHFPYAPEAGDGATAMGIIMLAVMHVGVITVYEGIKDRMLRSLEESAARTRLVLDNIGDGFLLAGPDGALRGEHSRAVEQWFGAATEQPVWDYLCDDETDRLRFRLGWEELVADVMPREMLVEQMPARVRRGERTFSVHYRVVGAERVEAVVVIVRDVTLELAARAAAAERAEHAELFERFARDPDGFRGFLAETRALTAAVRGSAGELQRRTLHTLKGNASIFGATCLAAWCHQLEDRIAAAEPADAADFDELARRVEVIEHRFGALLDTRADRLNVQSPDVDALRAALRAREPLAALEAQLDGWSGEPLRVVLGRMADHARGLARRLGHGEVTVRVDAPHLRVPRGRLDALAAACSHILRNAVDHGLEPREARVAAGKPPVPTICFAARQDGEAVVISIADDGRGVDWSRVRERASARGLPHDTHDELVEALFVDGFSTCEVATETSGRGVGMSAVREAVTRMGGRLHIDSEPGRGTTVTIALPPEALAPARSRSVPPPRSERPSLWH